MKCIATLFLTITYQQILRHRFAPCCHVNVTQIQMTVKVGISMKMMSMKYNLLEKWLTLTPNYIFGKQSTSCSTKWMMNNFVSRANQITLQLPTKVSFNIIAHLKSVWSGNLSSVIKSFLSLDKHLLNTSCEKDKDGVSEGLHHSEVVVLVPDFHEEEDLSTTELNN